MFNTTTGKLAFKVCQMSFKKIKYNLKDMSDDCMISEGSEWRDSVLSGELNSNVFIGIGT